MGQDVTLAYGRGDSSQDKRPKLETSKVELSVEGLSHTIDSESMEQDYFVLDTGAVFNVVDWRTMQALLNVSESQLSKVYEWATEHLGAEHEAKRESGRAKQTSAPVPHIDPSTNQPSGLRYSVGLVHARGVFSKTIPCLRVRVELTIDKATTIATTVISSDCVTRKLLLGLPVIRQSTFLLETTDRALLSFTP